MAGGISHRAADKLTDRGLKAFIKGAAPGQKLFDGGGLYVFITPAGSPVWRVKYRLFNPTKGKVTENVFAIGPYPDVSLEGARTELQAVKALLRAGRDPVAHRRVERETARVAAHNTFSDVTKEWLATDKRKGWSKIHRLKSQQALERDVLPTLGKLPVAEIRPAMVTKVIQKIAKRGAQDTAGKILQHVTGIFQLAQALDMCKDNPAVPVRQIITAYAPKPRPALLKWPELGDVLRKVEMARVSPAVRMAHRLCAFSACRISNVVDAEWREFHLDDEPPTWMIPRAKMKAQGRTHDHKVILGATIAAELRQWRALVGGKGYLFRSESKTGRVTREALEKVYRVTLGLEGKHTPHGWRSALSTLARDYDPKTGERGFERDVVELALDHIHDNEVVRAYDRGERLEQRIKLMQWWDAQLAQAQRGADVVTMKRA